LFQGIIKTLQFLFQEPNGPFCDSSYFTKHISNIDFIEETMNGISFLQQDLALEVG
jgi:hypothetical protein